MVDILVRNIDPDLKRRLVAQARRNGRSISDEAKALLDVSLPRPDPFAPEYGLGTWMHERFKEIGGVELDLPPRSASREPPDF
jgi:plasmid stability protein